MKVEPNVVITEFIVNMDNIFHLYENQNVNIAEEVQEQTASLAVMECHFTSSLIVQKVETKIIYIS